jgi:hypothetical protein
MDAPRSYAALKHLDAYLGGLQARGGFDYPDQAAVIRVGLPGGGSLAVTCKP